jgi:hypothetical protein
MMTSTREPAQHGGRDHRNPWPASIGTGGRFRPESPADFVGMRTECVYDDGESVFRHACKFDLEGIVAGGIALLQRPPARDAWENKVERLRNA